ncbi:hypothetical protein GQ53DRAFT_890587 [Thozetella sp. PMI_491]|nr:hypothetical protein GQ53DRAFT_890587 [Thozetella sp. PMI_491]
MSIQSVGVSLLEASQETNISLATLHFDLSIIKIKAPKEFQILRNKLVLKRKEASKNGVQHTTTYKLGALFRH